MIRASWRKRFSILQNRLYLYPPPEPLPRKRLFWLAMGMVTLAVLIFCCYFILYLTSKQNAFLTNAEDLGIMDQVVWNASQGGILRQTICNTIGDTNCVGPDGVVRFAIHFDPILYLVSVLYWFWPSPQTLVIFQTIVVALGAYPAFWLARLRLRNEMAAVAIALLYLLYPGQHQATVYDFHAVTLVLTLLMFMLYFMYTRRTVWLFVCALLALTTKEEILLVVGMLGLWSIVFQRRWKSGLALILLAGAWYVLTFVFIIPYFSPSGQHLLAGRYKDLGQGPVQIATNILGHPKEFIGKYIKEPTHLAYLRLLLSPAVYLPLLAPWVLILAVPSIALNLLSSNLQQYTGLFQYSAEIVPILIFSTIEALVLLLWLVQWLFHRFPTREEQLLQPRVGRDSSIRNWRPGALVHSALLVIFLGGALFSATRTDYSFHGQFPFSVGFQWPEQTAHTALAQRLIDMVPQDASVSAQTRFVPHMSHRSHIYLFPYAKDSADYIFLDVTSDLYPYYGSESYIRDVKSVLLSGNYGILAAQNGYLLLKRGLPPPGVSSYSALKPGPDLKPADINLVLPNIPDDFCQQIYSSPQDVTNKTQATFTDPSGQMKLVGYSFAGLGAGTPATFSHSAGYMSVTTYWQVDKPMTKPMQLLFLMQSSNGKEYSGSSDFPTVFWCQTNTWKPGTIVRVTSRVFGIMQSHIPNGLAHMSIALLPLTQPSSTIMDMQARIPVQVENGVGTAALTTSKNALQLMPVTIVP